MKKIFKFFLTFIIFLSPMLTYGASYNWNQTDWTGGIDLSNFPDHDNNQSGWTEFYSKDTEIDHSTGGQLGLSQTSSTWMETSDTDFNAGATSTVIASGTGSDTDLILTSTSNWSLGKEATNDEEVFSSPILEDSNNNLYWATSDGVDAVLYRSTDGINWTEKARQTTPSTYSIQSNYLFEDSDGHLYWSFGYDHFNHANKYVYMYKSIDDGENWSLVDTIDLGPGLRPSKINSIVIEEDNLGYILWGMGAYGEDSYVYKSSDNVNKNNWTMPNLSVPIYADPGQISILRDGSDVYFSTSNADNGGTGSVKVFKSTNSGAWSEVLEVSGKSRTNKLFKDSSGNIYVIVGQGSGNTNFYIYRISPGDSWENVYTYSSGNNYVDCDMMEDGDGNLYVTTASYETRNVFLFKSNSNGSDTGANGSWSLLDTKDFITYYAHSVDLLEASDGTLYWSAGNEDNSAPTYNDGTAYLYSSTDGNTWSEIKNYKKTSTIPNVDLLEDNSGVLHWSISSAYRGGSGSAIYSLAPVYDNNGTYTSASKDLGQASNFGNLEWTEDLPTNTDIRFRIATNNDNATWNFIGPDGTVETYYTTSSGEDIHSSHDGDRYIKYKAYFTTTDTAVTPTLSDITVNYSYYGSSQSLISSPYDTGQSGNLLSSIAWGETKPANTDVKFQIRTAPDNSGAPGAWTSWLGPTDGSDYYTDPSGGESINSNHSDLSNDQWIQYQIWLETTDQSALPYLTDFTLSYLFPDIQFTYTSGSGVESLTSTSTEIILSDILGSDATVNYTVTGTASGSGLDYTLADGTATVTAGNTTTTIPFTVVDDDLDENTETIIITLSSPTNSVLGSNTTFTYSITDDDIAGMTQSKSTATVTEDGTTDSYTLVLDSEPENNVVVTITPDAQTSVSPSTLTFTSANWNVVQTVTITAVDDDEDEDDSHSGTISHTVASSDSNYNGYSLSDITVTITDNDSSGGGSINSGPPTQGSGEVDEAEIPMYETRSIGEIEIGGNNLLMYYQSTANFTTHTSGSGSQNHSLTIDNVNLLNNIITVTIHSNPLTLELALDEVQFVDLDGDGVDDLELKFEDLHVNRVEVTMLSLLDLEDNDLEDNLNSFWTTGRWIKVENNPAVYLLDSNNVRHAYPNEKIWYSYPDNDFNNVETISSEEMANYTLGRNVPYNVGSLFKIRTIPKVYVVTEDNDIKWIKTEEAAIRLYGIEWNQLVDDLPDAFFIDYTLVGEVE